MIAEITRQLYSLKPKETLYHYTSFQGLMGIVQSGALWASDIRYMNDAAELVHTANLIKQEVHKRLEIGSGNPQLLSQFQDWVRNRITNGHMLFATSFRSNGNLLSQWRGYSSPGKGVSIGFSPEYIVDCTRQEGFEVGRCLYDSDEQMSLISSVVDSVETMAELRKTSDFQSVFADIETDLLRIAAVLKHPSFQEEDEWRVVSPAYTDYVNSPVEFREGTSMIVPYIEFRLLSQKSEPIELEHLFLGPTPNISISMNSLAMFLNKKGIRPKQPLSYCDIPYRQR